MILLVDAGNTCLKWGFLEGGVVQTGGRAVHAGEDLKTVIATAWAEVAAPERVIVANVAGQRLAKTLRAWIKRTWKVAAEFAVATEAAGGVRNAYREPGRLGIDRWAALIGARRHNRGAACVVDCGTAITIDVLGQGGDHLGGLIVPGLHLMPRCLAQTATGVAEPQEPSEDVSLLARDTHGAVVGGALYAAVAMIDRVAADVGAELGRRPALVLTGGDAPSLRPLLAGPVHHAPDLVLEGLAVLAGETSCVT